MFLVDDMCSDYDKIITYRDLKNLLIECICNFIRENEEEDYSNELDDLKRLATRDYVDVKFIINSLKSYGYNVINLVNLEHDLSYFKDYLSKKGLSTEDSVALDRVMELINK